MATAPTPTPATDPAFIDQPSKTEQFLELHFKKIVLFLLLVVLAVVAWGAMRYLHNQKEREAGQLFTAAKSVEDFDIVVQRFPDTAAAGNALLLKAQALATEGKKESAIEVLQEFLSKHSGHELTPTAKLALATQQAAIGKKEEARAGLEALMKESPNSEIAPAVQLQLGDLLWAEGKVDEAKALYEGLPQAFPGKMTTFNEDLDRRLELMKANPPMEEIEAPKAAAPAPAPTPVPAPIPAPAAEAPAPTSAASEGGQRSVQCL